MSKQVTIARSLKISKYKEKKKEENNDAPPLNEGSKVATSDVNTEEGIVIDLEDFEEFEDEGAFLDNLSQEDSLKISKDIAQNVGDLQDTRKDELKTKDGSTCVGEATSATKKEQERVPFNSSILLSSAIQPEKLDGFDEDAGQTWTYPINYPMRDYQFNIAQKALFRNTLVSLPTGLGKTFIAAVVMYNFYKWYPSGKVVFLAPTKPLVAQQIQACYNVMGIQQEVMAEMTGNLAPSKRSELWSSKRVFFLTPQVIQNDLTRHTCPVESIVCIVIDEAHRALGNHAYCQVIRQISSNSSRFRVLALSATPGDDLKAVQQVVTNLNIAHIELRAEDSFDIQAYTHKRKTEKIVVPLEGEILRLKTEYLKVLQVILQRLVNRKVMYSVDPERLHKFQLLQARDRFRMNPPPNVNSRGQAGQIEGDFALAISLYHAYELLELHGMRNFYHFLKNNVFKGHGAFRARSELGKNAVLAELLQTLEESYGEGEGEGVDGEEPSLARQPSENVGSCWKPQPLQSGAFMYSHPKLKKLEEIVVNHFKRFSETASSSKSLIETRVMIFSQYRESVKEIADLLSRNSPLIRVMSFVGHASSSKNKKGLSQKEQLEVVRKFRSGGYNTLVATCVGEEGLDIGEVDLIVCFDANKSPVRLVQRMGRTGRKRDGRIVSLMTEGREEQMHMRSLSNKNHIHKAIQEHCKNLVFFQNSPRMVPRQIQPTLHKKHFKIGEFNSEAGKKVVTSSKGKNKNEGKQSRLSFGLPVDQKSLTCLSDAELLEWKERYAISEGEASNMESCIRNTLTPSLVSAAFLEQASSKGRRSSLLSQEIMKTFQDGILYAHEDRPFNVAKWYSWQTAPGYPKSVPFSDQTQKYMKVYDFMDYMESNPEVASSYDVEMKTFLKEEDVNVEEVGRSCSVEGDEICQRRPQKRMVIVSDEDEDDFEIRGPSTVNMATNAQPASCNRESPKQSTPFHKIHETTMSCGDASPHIVDTIVPPPPSLSQLDWIDHLSQSQSISQVNASKASPLSLSLVSPWSLRENFPNLDSGENPKTEKPPKDSQVTFKAPPPLELVSSRADLATVSEKDSDLSDYPKKQEMENQAEFTADDKLTEENVLQRDIQEPNYTKDLACLSPSILDGPGEKFDTPESLHEYKAGNKYSISTPNIGSLNSPNYQPTVTLIEEDGDEEDESILVCNRRRKHIPQRNALLTPSPIVGGPLRSALKRPLAGNSTNSEADSPIHKRSRTSKSRATFKSDDSLVEEHSLIEDIDSGDSCEQSDEDWQKCEKKFFRNTAKGFIDKEAVLSDGDIGQYSSDEPEGMQDNYNIDDSFINDATMLTQITPTQKLRKHKQKKSVATFNSYAMYQKSLRSPLDSLFPSRMKNANMKPRMVFSQRHGIIRKYARKAGLKIPEDHNVKSKSSDSLMDISVTTGCSTGREEDEESEAEEVLVHYDEESEAEEVLVRYIDGQSVNPCNCEEHVNISNEDNETEHKCDLTAELYKDLMDDFPTDKEQDNAESQLFMDPFKQDTLPYKDMPARKSALCNHTSPSNFTHLSHSMKTESIQKQHAGSSNRPCSPSPDFRILRPNSALTTSYGEPTRNVTTSDSRATTSDSRATTSESRATTSDSRATTSDSRATTSDSRATTSESRATTSDSRATTSDSRATTSDSRATTSDSRATISDSRATTSDSRATTSESRATTSDSRATTSESRATTSDSRATTSESRATTSESRATTSDSRATTSDSRAITSDSRATTSDSRATTSESRATTSDSRATTSDSRAITSDSRATTSDSRATTSESRATTSDSRATTSNSRATITFAVPARSKTLSNTNVFTPLIGPGIMRYPPEKMAIGQWSERFKHFSLGMDEWLCSSGEEEVGDIVENEDEILTQIESDLSFSMCDSPPPEVANEKNGTSPQPASISLPSSPINGAGMLNKSGAPEREPGRTWPIENNSLLTKLKLQVDSKGSRDTKLRILADSREIAKSLIVTILRQTHNITVDVGHLRTCSFAVSYRMAVERRTVSELSTPSTFTKIAERLRNAGQFYAKRCLIIEKDRIRENRKIWAKAPKSASSYEHHLCQLLQTNITVLHSDGSDMTASLMAKLAQKEFQSGYRIIHPFPSTKNGETMMKILLEIETLNVPLILTLCGSFNNIAQIAQSTSKELCTRFSYLSCNEASKLIDFFKHKFCSELV